MRLSGKTILLTGADQPLMRGIGAALAAEGARIVFAAQDEATAAAAASDCPVPGQFSLALDVANESSWQDGVQTVLQRAGRIDAFVSAPAPLRRGALASWSLADWRAFEDEHLLGPWLGLRRCIGAMRSFTGGAIVLLSTTLARQVDGDLAANAAVAAGLRTMMQAAVVECGNASDGIRINAVLVDPAAGLAAADVAPAVIYLLSPEASFVTAMELVIDDARSLTGGVP